MTSVLINNFLIYAKEDVSLLNIIKYSGLEISRFCHHDNLNISGNCRACLIEVQGAEKPLASCVAEIEPDMNIWTESLFSKKAKENIMETLLRNHPLDCPICDQAGECDLQDQTKKIGGLFTRYFFKKRSVSDKNCGFFIKTIMTRCIHCTRCVRFNILNDNENFGMLGRGHFSEIGNYINNSIDFELSGNIIDLCPVGALTGRTYSFQNRPWELKITEGLDLTDGICSNIYVNHKDDQIYKISPKPNKFLNGNIITDKTRFSYDALTTNRLKKVYQYDFSKTSYQSLTWFTFLNKVNVFKNSEIINILITEDLDLENLIILKKLSYKFCNKIKLCLLNASIYNNNFIITNLTNTLIDLEKKSQFCILLSSNVKIECAILNFKIKFKYKQKLFSIFSFGNFFATTTKINFISLNFENLLLMWESKLKKISFKLINKAYPALLIGESFDQRIFDFKFYIFFFKWKLPQIIILKINLFCNKTGLISLNVLNTINHKLINKFLCIGLNDNLIVRKYILTKNQSIIWLNTHRPYLKLVANYLLPISTSFENDGIYLNLEGQVQKSQKIFNSLYNSKSLKSILYALFENSNYFSLKNTIFFKFIFELAENKQRFNYLTKKIKFFLNFNKSKYLKISIYPFKTILENYYCSTNFTKNSLILKNYETLIINNNKNF